MKKGVLVCAAVLALAAFAPRPMEAAVTFDLGLKGGVSISNARWSDDDGSEKSLVKPTFGVFATINVTPTIAIQPEVNYLTVGELWSDTLDDTAYKDVLFQNYLHIPVLLKARLSQQGQIVPVIFAGPAVNVLLSAHDKTYVDGVLDDDENVKEWFKSTEFGVDFGVAAEMMMSSIKLIIDLRYYLGLTNPYIEPEFYSVKNNAVMITIGAGFDLSAR